MNKVGLLASGERQPFGAWTRGPSPMNLVKSNLLLGKLDNPPDILIPTIM